MKNIELKISIKDFREILSILKKIGAKYIDNLRQIDHYYNYSDGRLKIREINNQNFELIFYQRPDYKNSKISKYQILKIRSVNLKSFKYILNQMFGEKLIVRKKRKLWLYKNTRIHLDQVNNLGNFLELETVATDIDFNKAKNEHKEVINLLNLTKYPKYSRSYSDMFLQKRNS